MVERMKMRRRGRVEVVGFIFAQRQLPGSSTHDGR
jgi:hypothetical protein